MISEALFIQDSSYELLVFFSIAVAKQVAISFLHVLDRSSTNFQREDFRTRRLSIQPDLAGTLIREKNTPSTQLTGTVLEPHWQ